MKNQDTSCAPEKSRYGGKLPLNHIEIRNSPFLIIALFGGGGGANRLIEKSRSCTMVNRVF